MADNIIHLTPAEANFALPRATLLESLERNPDGSLDIPLEGTAAEKRGKKSEFKKILDPTVRLFPLHHENEPGVKYSAYFGAHPTNSITLRPDEVAILEPLSERIRDTPHQADGSVLLEFENYRTAKTVLDWIENYIKEQRNTGNERAKLVRLRFKNSLLPDLVVRELRLNREAVVPSNEVLNARIRQLAKNKGAVSGRFGEGQSRTAKKNKISKLVRAATTPLNPFPRFGLKLKQNRKTRRTRRNRK
jgi:hypothetical protein